MFVKYSGIIHYTEIGMQGAMVTMSHSDSKCSIGKYPLETISHYLLGT